MKKEESKEIDLYLDVFRKIFWATFTILKKKEKVEKSGNFVMYERIKAGDIWKSKTSIEKWPEDLVEVVFHKLDEYGRSSITFCFKRYSISVNKDTTGAVSFFIKGDKGIVLCDASVFLPKKIFKPVIVCRDPRIKDFLEALEKSMLFSQFSALDKARVENCLKVLSGES